MKVRKIKKARSDIGKCSNCSAPINAGDPYVWWKFRYGSKIVRCTALECYPLPRDLTNSSFLISLYDIQDAAVSSDAEDVVGMIEALADDTQDSLSNMPEHLQDTSPAGVTLRERVDALEDWQSRIDDAINCDEDWRQEQYDG